MPGNALIVGGSLGGLFAALALRKRGWEVSVYERSRSELSGRGAGIVTHPELFQALAAVGADHDERLGVMVNRRVCFEREGGIRAQVERNQIVASWDQIYRRLRAELPDIAYHPGMPLTGLTQDADRVEAEFGETAISCDLVVGADGIRSTVRSIVAPDVQPVYAGYVAWRGLVDEQHLSDQTREALMTSFAFALPPGEQMLGYPVPGAAGSDQPGERRFNFVWYRPAQGAALEAFVADQPTAVHRAGIAPSAIRSEAIAEMRCAAEALLPPVFREVVEKTETPFVQPIYDLQSDNILHGRTALIGDAAFVARPHVGMGVTKAAQDAVTLANALSEDRLLQWSQERYTAGCAVVARAQHLGSDVGQVTPSKDAHYVLAHTATQF